MNKFLLSLICLFLLFSSAEAQQDPLYGLYLNNPLMINPAYAGLNNNLNIMAGFRKQWAGFDGAPTTMSFSAHTSIRDNNMGAGLVVVRDQIGEVSNLQVTAVGSYKVKLSDDKILSFGMQAGVNNYKSDGGKVLLQDPGDPAFATISQVKPTIGAGIMLKSETYMFGLSVPRLLNSTFNIQGQNFNVYQQHFYFFGTYVFNLSERIQFRPATLIKAVKGSPLSADVNLNLNFDRHYTVGVYTRNLNAYGILAQLNFGGYYKLAYAFEVPTNSSVGTRYSTNEINLGIKISAFSFHDRSLSNF